MSKWNVNGKKIGNSRKIVVKSFKEVGFKIEVKGNFRRVNFLDVTLNLTNNIYKSYKTNQKAIHTSSSHPPQVIRLPPWKKERKKERLKERLSIHSSNKQVFNIAKPIYK